MYNIYNIYILYVYEYIYNKPCKNKSSSHTNR